MQLSLAMLLCQLNKGLTQFILQTPRNSTLPCINVIYRKKESRIVKTISFLKILFPVLQHCFSANQQSQSRSVLAHCPYDIQRFL